MVEQASAAARVAESAAPLESIPGRYFAEPVGQETDGPLAVSVWLLWERRAFLKRALLWGVVLTAIIAFVIPKTYESTTRLMPPDDSGSSMAMLAALAGKSSGLASLGGDLLGLKSSGALFSEILQGRTVQDRIIDRFDLRKEYRDKYWADARKDLSMHTTVDEDRRSGVITIRVSDHDPQRAAAIAQAYVEELDRLVAEVSTSAARRERIFIEQRLQTVKRGLDAASQQFSQYASQNTTVDLTAQGKAMVDAAARLEGELIAARSELEGLEQIYTPNNVRVRSLRARVDELNHQLQKLSGDASGGTSQTQGGGDEFPSIRQLPIVGVRWADLYRQTKIQETVYELLTQQYELAKIQEAKEIPVVKVLDAADVPEKKSFPSRSLLIALGAVLSLVAGSAWIIGQNYWELMDERKWSKSLVRELSAAASRKWRAASAKIRRREADS
jgi:uncharacterized protein involved in exopolysaccharide biosynthesis